MATYHFRWKPVKRSDGRTAVASAAYRAGERLRDERTGYLYDYRHRQKDAGISSWIQTPDGAPSWTRERSELWNHAEAAEKRKNSQTAYEAEVGLPRELTREQQDRLLRQWVEQQFTESGMVADVCIHRGDRENPHAHIMLTTRELEGEEFAPTKATEHARSWDGPKAVEAMRQSWEVYQNRELEEAGSPERVDRRTLKEQGVLREPTVHEGPNVRAMAAKQIYTERGAENRGVQLRNQELQQRLAQERQREEYDMQEQQDQRQEEQRRREEAEKEAQRERQTQPDEQRDEEVSQTDTEDAEIERRRQEREERERQEQEWTHEEEE